MRKLAFCAVAVCFSFIPALLAQDAVKVDPKHYSVVSENDQVRILKIHYGPHEKSVMHSHPNLVAVFLTDSKVKMTLPNGKTEERSVAKGQAMWTDAGTHLPENVGDTAMDGILVELKGKAGAAKPANAAAKPKTTAPKK
jgi:quercetin dioxygenase-like cupin family protein